MSEPKLLLLDEPSAGLARVVVQQVFELVKRIRGGGLTVLIVEQNVAGAGSSIALRARGRTIGQSNGGRAQVRRPSRRLSHLRATRMDIFLVEASSTACCWGRPGAAGARPLRRHRRRLDHLCRTGRMYAIWLYDCTACAAIAAPIAIVFVAFLGVLVLS
jgi:hypothetical protein